MSWVPQLLHFRWALQTVLKILIQKPKKSIFAKQTKFIHMHADKYDAAQKAKSFQTTLRNSFRKLLHHCFVNS